MTDSDLPGLYQAANAASLDGQSTFLRLVKADLILIVSSALLATLAIESTEWKVFLAIASAILMLFGLGITIATKQTPNERDWYDGRAVAESVKTSAWRYAMRAEPFDSTNDKGADAQFVKQLEAILNERKDVAKSFPPDALQKPEISDQMKQLRAKPLAERKEHYLTHRVGDQQSWYAGKASWNSRRERKLFYAILGCQLAAILSAFGVAKWPEYRLAMWPYAQVNLTGFLAAMASSILAWLQLKQHRTLAQAYSLAALELNRIKEQAKHIQTEEEFSQFVGDSENAMSREHTMWIARRDSI